MSPKATKANTLRTSASTRSVGSVPPSERARDRRGRCVANLVDEVQEKVLGHNQGHWVILLLWGGTLISVGALAWSFTGGNGTYGSSVEESFWISYMLFIDPGTQTGIPVDDPISVKLVSVLLSFMGFVFSLTFLGTVVELIRETLKRYKDLYRRFNIQRHVLILGWNDKTLFLLSELLSAEQQAGLGRDVRPLRRCGFKRLNIVVLARRKEIDMTLEVDMYFHDSMHDTSRIYYREGDPTDRVELLKVSASKAQSILVMGADRRGADQEVIRTLLALAALPEGPLQGEVYGDMHHPESLNVIGTLLPDAEGIVARIKVNRVLVLRALVPSVGYCMKEMASFKEGNELYLQPVPSELVGLNFWDAAQLFTHSVICGVRTANGLFGSDNLRLMPEASRKLLEGDELLALARSKEDAELWQRARRNSADSPTFPSESPSQLQRCLSPRKTLQVTTADILQDDGQLKLGPSTEGPKIVLMIGCPHDFANFLDTIDGYLASGSAVHLLSTREIQWRNAALKAYAGDAGVSIEGGFGLERVEVHHHVGDGTRKGDLARLPLATASCALILSERHDNEEPIDADTRSLSAAIALKALLSELKERKGKCKIATEILDAETEKVICSNSSVRRTGSFVYTSSLEAGLLAMAVAQKTSFNIVKQLLQKRSGAGYIVAVSVGVYVTEHECLCFLELRERVWKACRGILLGWRRKENRYPTLNPPDKTELLDWWADSADEFIVMRRPDARAQMSDSRHFDIAQPPIVSPRSMRNFRLQPPTLDTDRVVTPCGSKDRAEPSGGALAPGTPDRESILQQPTPRRLGTILSDGVASCDSLDFDASEALLAAIETPLKPHLDGLPGCIVEGSSRPPKA